LIRDEEGQLSKLGIKISKSGMKEQLSKIRGPHLYECLKEPAQGVKVLLQMIVGTTGSIIVLVVVLRDIIHGGMSATDVAHHVLAIIAASLAVAASLELAYTLFTPGPDEAVDPLMLSLSAVFLYLVSNSKTSLGREG
jgi:hypothetical protein